MRPIKVGVVLLLASALVVGLSAWSLAAEQKPVPLKLYEGQIESVKIDHCGLQPGTCEGSIVLAQKGGGEVTLAIKPGTWVQRGEHLVLIDELGVGNYVKAEAARLPGSSSQREQAIMLQEATGGE